MKLLRSKWREAFRYAFKCDDFFPLVSARTYGYSASGLCRAFFHRIAWSALKCSWQQCFTFLPSRTCRLLTWLHIEIQYSSLSWKWSISQTKDEISLITSTNFVSFSPEYVLFFQVFAHPISFSVFQGYEWRLPGGWSVSIYLLARMSARMFSCHWIQLVPQPAFTILICPACHRISDLIVIIIKKYLSELLK